MPRSRTHPQLVHVSINTKFVVLVVDCSASGCLATYTLLLQSCSFFLVLLYASVCIDSATLRMYRVYMCSYSYHKYTRTDG